MPGFRRIGRGGLLGAAARTAVVAGTATAVSGSVAARQRSRAEQQADMQQHAEGTAQPAEAVSPPVSSVSPESEKLQQLAALHAQGVLTDDEFTAAKARILGI